jgi:hypothetical protein
MHASGRAIDIYLSVREPQEKALGKLLYGMFKDNAAVATTGHVIYDGLAWSPGNAADRSTHDAGIRDLHDDHVHVDFNTTRIEGTAHHLVNPIRFCRQRMPALYKEWVEGYYGPAFNPTSNNTHLSATERLAIYNVNKGVTSMSLAPDYLRAVEQAIKWRAAGKLPGPADAT